MIPAHSYFRFVSNVTIVLNLCVGLGALYLIERMVPAIEEVLEENAYTVAAVLKMQESLLAADAEASKAQAAKDFWFAFGEAQNNVTIENEDEVIQKINSLASRFWGGEKEVLPELRNTLILLSDMNLTTMSDKNKMAKTIGVAGAWAIGFLILFALVLQLSLRRRMFSTLVQPATGLLIVIGEYARGNLQRRYFPTPEAAVEIKRTGELLNTILDENMSAKLK